MNQNDYFIDFSVVKVGFHFVKIQLITIPAIFLRLFPSYKVFSVSVLLIFAAFTFYTQDSTNAISLSGYVETYYCYDFGSLQITGDLLFSQGTIAIM